MSGSGVVVLEAGVIVSLYLALIWPSRFLVKKVLASMPWASRQQADGSGAMVGVLERLLVFTLILVGEWTVIGFVVAAKSIARFPELEDKLFSDYYLAGTFMSLLTAVAAGLGQRLVVFCLA